MMSHGSVCVSPCGCGYVRCVIVWAPEPLGLADCVCSSQTLQIKARRRPFQTLHHFSAQLLQLPPLHSTAPTSPCCPSPSPNLSPSLTPWLPELPLHCLPLEALLQYSFSTL